MLRLLGRSVLLLPDKLGVSLCDVRGMFEDPFKEAQVVPVPVRIGLNEIYIGAILAIPNSPSKQRGVPV